MRPQFQAICHQLALRGTILLTPEGINLFLSGTRANIDTMHAANGAGLAAPQIGVNLQLVIYGFKDNARYPDAPAVPETVLINPVLTPLSDKSTSASISRARASRLLRATPASSRPKATLANTSCQGSKTSS